MRTSIGALVFSLLACAALAQTPDAAKLDQAARDALTAWNLPGLAVVVVQNDRVVLAQGYGVKDAGTRAPVTADTLFGLGSTTKAFTTTALAMLVDEKKLGWDDPVSRHLDYFRLADPCADALVTIRDIVSHRTGLGRHDELWDNSPWTREEVIRRAAALKLSKPIRAAYQYNNIMFMAAGEVVAAESKMTWDDFVRTRIFQPLGMSRTLTGWNQWRASADHATGYDWTHEQVVAHTPADDTNVAPAGSIKTTAHDMAQWLRFQLANGTIDGKRLVSEEALQETKTPQMALRLEKSAHETNPFTNVQSYAMGWNVQDYRGELLVAHAGALGGFRTHVALLPYRNAGVVVMTNIGRGFGVIALRNTLLDILLGAPPHDWNAVYLGVEKRANETIEKAKREREAKRIPNTRPSHDLAAYAGTYHNPAYGDAVIALENGSLVLHWSRMTIPLVHYHYDLFTATSEPDDVDEMVEFRTGAEGNITSMTIFGEEFRRDEVPAS